MNPSQPLYDLLERQALSHSPGARKFSIRDIEKLSGVKAHTIRTWELRHGIPRPQRTSSNLRSYSIDELKLILDIAVLTRAGYRISMLCNSSLSQIGRKLDSLKNEEDLHQIKLNRLIVSMHRLDIEEFEEILTDCFKEWAVRAAISKIIFPFLRRTDLLLQGNGLSEEHLVVTAIRKKLIWAIENDDTFPTNDYTVLLFLPGTKQLDLALLYACFQLKTCGRKVIYMGNDVSIDNLQSVVKMHKPHLLYTYLPGKSNFDIEGLAAAIRGWHPRARLIFSSAGTVVFARQHSNLAQMNFERALSFLCLDEGMSDEE